MPLAPHPETISPSSAIEALAEELIASALATRKSEALLVCAQAALLAWLSVEHRVGAGGFVKLSDLTLQLLGMSARTLRERLRVHRLFVKLPAVEEAFLEGRMSLCQVLAAAPVFEGIESADEDAASRWIAVTETASVRAMKRHVREKKEAGRIAAEVDQEGLTISFRAPASFRITWDGMINLARKHLGRDAPVHACMAAVLAESGWAGLGPMPAKVSGERRGGIEIRPRGDLPYREEAIAHARQTLRSVSVYIEDVRDLMESGQPRTAHDAVERLKQINLLRAPQKVLFAHLIRDLRASYAMDALGYRSMADLVEDRLRLSERSARNRVAESLLFESSEEIEAAFGRGEITLMQAHLLRRLAQGVAVRPFVERAKEVSWRQLQREARILELLRKCGLGSRTRRPLPDSGMEEAIVEELGAEGEAIEAKLRERGLSPLPEDGSEDPAENTIRMQRLEALVEMLVLKVCDEPSATWAERQMSAGSGQEVRIRFWAPEETGQDFLHAIEKLRHRVRPAIPAWAALRAIFEEVEEEWLREDPERRPASVKILRRDDYRCVVPGCTSRSRLEDHHIVFRSRGGSNDPENRATLCHGHHRRGVHEGRIRITGRAPHRLRFELGCRPDGPPLLVLQGEKIVDGMR